MAELSSENNLFMTQNDFNLSLAICNELRPEFEKGTPEFYKELAYRCMDANPNKRQWLVNYMIYLNFGGILFYN